MLTFFDYLRQRAFESVLAGAQEALEVLEDQRNHVEPKAVPAPEAKRSLDFRPNEGSKQEEKTSNNDTDAADDDPLKPARRRGRPHQKRKGDG